MAHDEEIHDYATKLTEALQTEHQRVKRWLIASIVLAVMASLAAVGTKSAAFIVVALFAYFFVWNRWKVCSLLRETLLRRDENDEAWITSATTRLEHPPHWSKISDYIAAVTFLAICAVTTFFVVLTSGVWMRLWIAICWFAAIAILIFRWRFARKSMDART